jgi:putative Holliday junction resolvase
VRKIALDVGGTRIGVALSQDNLALPHSVILNGPQASTEIASLITQYDPACIYVGLPLSMSGSHTASTRMAIDFAKALGRSTTVAVRMIDERLTSKSAARALQQAGKNTRAQRGIIDASAAAMILEFALSAERDGLAGKSLEDLDA